jgi:uncharacterized protein
MMSSEIEQKPVVFVDQKQERNWGILCHLSALVLFIGIPFGNIIGPLVVWLIKKNELPLVDQEGKESLNFQISMTIYASAAAILILLLIGFPLLIGLMITDLILTIIAAVKVSNGESYRYPLTIRLIK